jgi:hypothetical protein
MSLLPLRKRRAAESGRHTIAAVRSAQAVVTGAPAEGQTDACRKCHLVISMLGGIWTVTEDGQFGEINCHADLSAPYAPHEPGGTPLEAAAPRPEITGNAAELVKGINAEIAHVPPMPAGGVPPAPDVLARVLDGLRKSLPGGPAPLAVITRPDPSPAAWMRSFQHDGRVLPVALWGAPSVAGYRDSGGIAGIYLGEADSEGQFAIDADVAYLDRLIAVAQEARDELVHRGSVPVPAAVNGGVL